MIRTTHPRPTASRIHALAGGGQAGASGAGALVLEQRSPTESSEPKRGLEACGVRTRLRPCGARPWVPAAGSHQVCLDRWAVRGGPGGEKETVEGRRQETQLGTSVPDVDT